MTKDNDSVTFSKLMSRATPWLEAETALKLGHEGVEGECLGLYAGAGFTLSDAWMAAVKSSVELESMSKKNYSEDTFIGSVETSLKKTIGKRHSVEFGPRLELQYGKEWSLDDGEREDETHLDFYAGPAIKYRYHGLWAKVEFLFGADRLRNNVMGGYSKDLEGLGVPFLESADVYARLRTSVIYDGSIKFHAAIGAASTWNLGRGWQALIGCEDSAYFSPLGPLENSVEFFAGLRKKIGENFGVELRTYISPW